MSVLDPVANVVRTELESLRQHALADPGAIDRFVDGRPFPLVEDRTSTFVYRGEADAVQLRHWVYGLPSTPAFTRLDGTDLWYLVLELPSDSRIEYKIEVIRGGAVESIEDPLNPSRARDPFGANSVLHTTGYERPAWTFADPEARTGTMERHRRPSDALGRDVDIDVYLPARFRLTGQYPLLVVHDGGDYLEYSAMQTVLDNLIHRLDMAEVVVAFTNPRERLVEYADFEPHARHIAEELVPWLEAELPLATTPAGTGRHGGELRRGRVVLRRPPVPGSVRPRAAAVRLLRLLGHRHQRARPALRAGRGDGQRLPGSSPRPSASRSSSAAAGTSR